MKLFGVLLAAGSALLLSGGVALGEIKVVVEHIDNDDATPAFKFKSIPPPGTSATARARFTILTGSSDENGGGLDKLHEGGGPSEADQPGENFFFGQATKGGRILVDLGREIAIKQINTYSWHPNTRGPQVYNLYASDVSAEGFDPKLDADADPAKAGWRLIAKVDTRPKDGPMGGQYGVSISDTDGVIGTNRYLLFDIFRTEDEDPFGNTFYSEIAVIDRDAPKVPYSAVATLPPPEAKKSYEMEGGKYHFTIDTTKAPKLTDWANQTLAPVVQDWYPKLVQLLPSEGFEAPAKFSIVFSTNFQGVAATGGTRITGNANWYLGELKREAVGSIVHEMVHVVQQYGDARRNNPDAARPPGWLVEGIPDYLRFYLFEPQTHGADIRSRARADRARYNGSYRVSANFLNFVVQKYDQDLIQQLNVAMREGKYSKELWKEHTGHTVEELGGEWKAGLLAKFDEGSAQSGPAESNTPLNTLTDAEKAAGWQLLFDGKDFNGWHNFKAEGVRPGWQVKDGILVCSDPHNAGDLVTSNKFDWFDLRLEYNITVAGNSGIMFHVTDAGSAAWRTGPEFQLEDNVKASDRQRCGWLYDLYKPGIDPKTGATLDATKPVGQWNQVRLLITPEKCEHYINGVKYVEYVLHSDDWNERVAKSKFARARNFAKEDLGSISLQGDHGAVSFRNIKILPLEAKK